MQCLFVCVWAFFPTETKIFSPSEKCNCHSSSHQLINVTVVSFRCIIGFFLYSKVILVLLFLSYLCVGCTRNGICRTLFKLLHLACKYACTKYNLNLKDGFKERFYLCLHELLRKTERRDWEVSQLDTQHAI